MKITAVITQFYYSGYIQGNRYRAPHGKIYEIRVINLSLITSADNFIGIFDSEVGYDINIDNLITTDLSGALIVLDTGGLSQGGSYIFDPPIRTKFITIGLDGTTVFSAHLGIHYELVDDTTSELIWEFVKKGRNP